MEKTKRILTVIGIIVTAVYVITYFLEESELITFINIIAKALMMICFVTFLGLEGFGFRPLKNKKQE